MRKIQLLLLVLALLTANLFLSSVQSRQETTIGGVPTGAILVINSASCPLGYTEVTALNGKTLVGTVAANGNVGGTGGSDSITPQGTISGIAVASHSYTPQGTNGTVNFTPVGTNSTPTFTGNAVVAASTNSGTKLVTSNTSTGVSPVTTATGTVSVPTFIGTQGAVPAETFTGTVATLTHTVSSQGTFAGTAFDPHPSFVRVIFCKKN